MDNTKNLEPGVLVVSPDTGLPCCFSDPGGLVLEPVFEIMPYYLSGCELYGRRRETPEEKRRTTQQLLQQIEDERPKIEKNNLKQQRKAALRLKNWTGTKEPNKIGQ